jgi:hypothetical protein
MDWIAASIRCAGTPGPGRSDSYVAANTFYNDPGNGDGQATNNNAFDPAVPKC